MSSSECKIYEKHTQMISLPVLTIYSMRSPKNNAQPSVLKISFQHLLRCFIKKDPKSLFAP